MTFLHASYDVCYIHHHFYTMHIIKLIFLIANTNTVFCLSIFSTTEQQCPLHIHVGERQQDPRSPDELHWITLLPELSDFLPLYSASSQAVEISRFSHRMKE